MGKYGEKLIIKNVSRDGEPKTHDLGLSQHGEYFIYNEYRDGWKNIERYQNTPSLVLVKQILEDLKNKEYITPCDYDNTLKARVALEHLESCGRLWKGKRERYGTRKFFEQEYK